MDIKNSSDVQRENDDGDGNNVSAAAIKQVFIELNNLYDYANKHSKLICRNDEEIELLQELTTSYQDGINICLKFFYNVTYFNEFCNEMLKADLKRFRLHYLHRFLPNELEDDDNNHSKPEGILPAENEKIRFVKKNSKRGTN